MNDRYRHWFETGDGMRPVTDNNRTSFFITGEEAFQDIGDELVATAAKDAEAYFLGWSFDRHITMRPGGAKLSTVSQLLSHFDTQGGFTRAMLWDNSIMANGAGTPEAAKFIQSLPHGTAILDRRTPLAGSHHQKVQVLVAGPGAKVPGKITAYCGGMDLFTDRIGPQGLHDVHCKILGDAGNELLKVFLDRWNDHPNRSGDFPTKRRPQDPKTGTDLVQVCCTYPKFESTFLYGLVMNRYGKTLNDALAAAGHPRAGDMTVDGSLELYSFYDATQGVQQVGKAVSKAISEAKKYIYVEEQYLVHQWVGQALAKKLAGAGKDFRIVILALHPDRADIQQTWRRRRDLLAPIRAVDPQQRQWRVLVRRLDRPHSYVHSKTWIFDDELVITGSANIDRRGFTYNSETDVVVAGDLTGDRRSSFGATTVAQELRCRLFAKHLGGRPSAYLNPAQAMARWFGEHSQTNVVPFNHDSKPGPPDKYSEALRAAAKEPTATGRTASQILTLMQLTGGPDNWLWDYVEDPDSNVDNP